MFLGSIWCLAAFPRHTSDFWLVPVCVCQGVSLSCELRAGSGVPVLSHSVTGYRAELPWDSRMQQIVNTALSLEVRLKSCMSYFPPLLI